MPTALWKLPARLVRGLTLALVAFAWLAFVALGLGPRTGLYQTVTVLTGSMAPNIPEGSIVVITPLQPRQVRVGDVLTYSIPVEDQRVVTHRVVEVLEGDEHPVVRTQGDANDGPDPWVARMEEGPLWKVRAVLPKGGHAIHTLRQPLARRICVLVLPLVVCAMWLREIWFPHPRRALA
ncbi:MAG TPA: signal peptidase I [Acidimicrobiales bacterium]|nr:signal peptidase I [Acidimicrobiales bacterium]